MKQGTILFSLTLLLLFTNGCKKSSSNSTSIEGTWELRHVSAMLTVNYPPGNGKTIKFEGSHYEMSENGQVTESGTFSIVPDATVSESTCMAISDGKYARRIIYSNGFAATKIFLQREGNKLNFISGCFAYDAGSVREYVKL